MSAPLATINCTSCGAGLSVLGGHTVRAQVCGYCGAVLDAQENYRVLTQYRDMPRPITPFKIGMSGKIKGVDFTIIGIIGMSMREDGETYSWVDHQVYSPTHGYCWLTYNEGHYVFTRRVRDLPSPAVPDGLDTRARISYGPHSFRVTESYTSRIDFCEGEFTWIPHVGDEERVVEAVAPPFQFAYVTREEEVEYELGEYLDRAEVLQSFGAETAGYDASGEPHPAEPYGPGRFHRAIGQAGAILFMVPIILYFVFSMMGGDGLLVDERFADSAASHQVRFTVDDPDRLLEMQLYSGLRNAWAFYDVTITSVPPDKDQEPEDVAAFGREISYYTGSDWSEGSQITTARFKLPAGTYTADIALGESESVQPTEALTVKLRQGVVSGLPLIGLAVFFGLCGISLPIRRFLAERRRQGSYGDDDDDDDRGFFSFNRDD